MIESSHRVDEFFIFPCDHRQAKPPILRSCLARCPIHCAAGRRNEIVRYLRFFNGSHGSSIRSKSIRVQASDLFALQAANGGHKPPFVIWVSKQIRCVRRLLAVAGIDFQPTIPASHAFHGGHVIPSSLLSYVPHTCET